MNDFFNEAGVPTTHRNNKSVEIRLSRRNDKFNVSARIIGRKSSIGLYPYGAQPLLS